jgi:hypothetical protein
MQYGYQIKEGQMGGAYSTHGVMKRAYGVLIGEREETTWEI